MSNYLSLFTYEKSSPNSFTLFIFPLDREVSELRFGDEKHGGMGVGNVWTIEHGLER